MKLKSGLITALLVLNLICFSQTINIHSISHNRQPNGGEYTLDGQAMSTSGRLKLLSTINFGTSGIYPKSVNIVDGFSASNSLTQVVNFPYSDLFFFGTYDKSDGTLIQFTNEEIDSLYNWSKQGGKLIICGSASSGTYDPAVLNSKWGFQITSAVPSSIVPNTTGLTTDIFNGSFGLVSNASQGGSAQGYFGSLPSSVSILATDGNSQPTIIMDCTTLDLIVVDVDVYTTLSGSVSAGSTITNDQDKFFANSFVFMDKLQTLPTINVTGTNLGVANVYNSYQWYKDDVAINGSTSNNIAVSEDGQYYVKVTVNGGCEVKSNIIAADSTLGVHENTSTSAILKIFPNPSKETFNIALPTQQTFNLRVVNVTGRIVHTNKNASGIVKIDCSTFSSGVYFVKAINEKVILTGKLIKE